ncbi:MAG: hypothetical protein WA136_11615, partial [Rhodoferax sp.]
MGTKQQPPGLLSKMARYFRAPDADQASAQDSLQTRSGEADRNPLTSLIERKRQDDLVRRREFNHLRKLYKQQRGTQTLGGEGIGRPSVFQHSSGFGADERASTLQKINAIEAHMVNAWARGKAPTEARMARRTDLPAPAKPATATPGTTPPAGPLPILTERRTAPVVEAPASDDFDLDFTGMLLEPTAPEPAQAPAAPQAPQTVAEPPPAAPVAPATAADDVPPGPLESGLQDAAMRFAEGDTAAAEAVLLGLLQSDAINAETVDNVVFALFDLYRATGQQDGFDVVAMDYAERFGRSPAEWFSLPDRLGRGAGAAVAAAPAAARGLPDQGAAWLCPSVLDAQALAALRARFPGPTANWHVDWTPLTEIAPQAAAAVSEVFTYWCDHPVQLHWSGVDRLLHALELHTPADNK